MHNPEEARRYLQSTTGEVRDRKLELDAQGRVKVDTHRQVNIDHAGLANIVLKYINIIPSIPKMSRNIMSMKIMNPGISSLQIALALGIREHVIPQYEHEGLERIKQFISRISMQDGINKFNAERVIQAEIKNMNKMGKANPLSEAA